MQHAIFAQRLTTVSEKSVRGQSRCRGPQRSIELFWYPKIDVATIREGEAKDQQGRNWRTGEISTCRSPFARRGTSGERT